MVKRRSNTIISFLFLLVFLCSCDTAPSSTISSEILCHDHSVRSADGALLAEISFEKPVISGLESEQAEENINTFFENRYQNWLNGTGDELTYGYDGYMQRFVEGLNGMREAYSDEKMAKHPLKYAIRSDSTYLGNDYFSAMQNFIWSSGGPISDIFYGTVFDTATGERVPVTELCDISQQGLYDELKSFLISQGGDGTELTDEFMYNFWYDGESLYFPLDDYKIAVHHSIIVKLTDGEFERYFPDSESETTESSETSKIQTVVAETSVSLTTQPQPSDEELIEMAKTAESYYLNYEEFTKNDEGVFLNENGEGVAEFKERVNQIFCDEMTNKFFDLYAAKNDYDTQTVCFNIDRTSLDYRIQKYGWTSNDYIKLDINDNECFEGYPNVLIGGDVWDSDISVEDRELLVAERTDEKITLRMTVWHQNPEFEYTEGEYCYRLENGRLVIDGIFSGRDEQYNAIVIPDEKSGTVVDVPISDDLTDFYNSDSTDICTDFLITYDSTLVLEDGKWKFDDFRIWY